jgi:signal transduction histidine kinase
VVWGLLGVIGVLVVCAMALAVANGTAMHNADLIGGFLQAIVPSIGLALVGGLIASRLPRNPMGWILLAGALSNVVPGVAAQYVLHSMVVARGSLPGVEWIAWMGSTIGSLTFPGIVALILLLFPNGHLLSPRWRAVVWLGVVVAVGNNIGGFLDPAPIQVAPGVPSVPSPLALGHINGLETGPVGYAVYFAGIVVVLAAVLSLLLRMRRSRGEEREQVRWVVYEFVVTVVVSVAYNLIALAVPALQSNIVSNVIVVVGFGLGFPAVIAIAMLRYHLYGIDVVISRTLLYGSLAVFITAVYVGIAVGIGALIGGGGKPNLGLSILATAIVAVGFQPVRERVQKVANRLVYGKRASPYEVLSQFSERVSESYAADDVMPRMARVLAEGTGAQRADVWLRSGAMWRDAAVWPLDSALAPPVPASNGTLPPVNGANRLVEVRHQGDLLGALAVTKRIGESLTPVEENLLSHLAGQAGLVLKNVGLTSDLQARLEELRASRQRLVTAQDAERRRLERNLHDGAQQHLVSLKVKLGLVEMLATRDPEKARATLAQLKDDADEALETLRDLARGIYPPLLADKGLVTALESQARKASLPVTVDAVGIGRYSQDVEAAVYFSVLEALQNVQKYAQASQANVRLRDEEGVLRFEIIDDGRGFDVATTKRGSGLVNMADRLDALGGEVEVTATPGHGTRLQGWLPVPAALPA